MCAVTPSLPLASLSLVHVIKVFFKALGFKSPWGASKTAGSVQLLAAKLDNPSSISVIHIVEGENRLIQSVL